MKSTIVPTVAELQTLVEQHRLRDPKNNNSPLKVRVRKELWDRPTATLPINADDNCIIKLGTYHRYYIRSELITLLENNLHLAQSTTVQIHIGGYADICFRLDPEESKKKLKALLRAGFKNLKILHVWFGYTMPKLCKSMFKLLEPHAVGTLIDYSHIMHGKRILNKDNLERVGIFSGVRLIDKYGDVLSTFLQGFKNLKRVDLFNDDCVYDDRQLPLDIALKVATANKNISRIRIGSESKFDCNISTQVAQEFYFERFDCKLKKLQIWMGWTDTRQEHEELLAALDKKVMPCVERLEFLSTECSCKRKPEGYQLMQQFVKKHKNAKIVFHEE